MIARYEIDEIPSADAFLPDLLRISEAVARLDERAALSPLLDGWRERMLFEEVVATQWADGELIHVDELIQLDAGARYQIGSIPLACALQHLALYRRGYRDGAAALLADELPGIMANQAAPRTVLSEATQVHDRIDLEKLVAWRRVMRAAASHPPLLHAAISWDSWRALLPEHSGAWRGSAIASLIVRARGLSAGFFLPISLGAKLAKFRWQQQLTIDVRIKGFLRCAEASVAHASKQLVALKHASDVMELHLHGHRKNSRLAAVIALLLSKPVVSIPLIAKHLNMSQRGAAILMDQLGSTPRLITSRDRYRLWQVC